MTISKEDLQRGGFPGSVTQMEKEPCSKVHFGKKTNNPIILLKLFLEIPIMLTTEGPFSVPMARIIISKRGLRRAVLQKMRIINKL